MELELYTGPTSEIGKSVTLTFVSDLWHLRANTVLIAFFFSLLEIMMTLIERKNWIELNLNQTYPYCVYTTSVSSIVPPLERIRLAVVRM